ATCLLNIGAHNRLIEKYTEAMDSFERGKAIFEKIGNRRGLANAWTNIGLVNKAREKYSEALEDYAAGLRLYEEIGDVGESAITLNNISEICLLQARYAEALDVADRARAIATQNGSLERLWHSRSIAGRSYRALNRIDESRRALTEAVEII